MHTIQSLLSVNTACLKHCPPNLTVYNPKSSLIIHAMPQTLSSDCTHNQESTVSRHAKTLSSDRTHNQKCTISIHAIPQILSSASPTIPRFNYIRNICDNPKAPKFMRTEKMSLFQSTPVITRCHSMFPDNLKGHRLIRTETLPLS